jgi:hypothetical protein
MIWWAFRFELPWCPCTAPCQSGKNRKVAIAAFFASDFLVAAFVCRRPAGDLEAMAGSGSALNGAAFPGMGGRCETLILDKALQHGVVHGEEWPFPEDSLLSVKEVSIER